MRLSMIFILEDEKDLAQLVAYHLGKEGFQTRIYQDGRIAYQAISKEIPDLIILDLMLPGIGGLEICRLMRAQETSKKIPILILTAKGEEIDRVVGFEMGADDYMVKPFSPRELILRVKAILKRIQPSQQEVSELLRIDNLKLDLAQYRVWVAQEEIFLTRTEFKLLQFLLESQGRILTRDLLLDRVWGYESEVTTRTVDTHMTRLREKLKSKGDLIETVRGVGYRLKQLGPLSS